MPCEWPVDETCLPELPELGDEPSGDQLAAFERARRQRETAVALASQVLWALSGRQFGVCPVVVRPCPRPALPWSAVASPSLWVFADDIWREWSCGCVGSCTVTGPRVVHLPGPVHSIVEVTVAGETLDPGDYHLEGDALYRVGGAWPQQDLGRPLGEPGTWSVTYKRGRPVPAGVDRLTAVLAREFLLACGEDDRCRLPRTVVSTSRRGVSHEFDPKRILDAGKTGLPEVDSWLAAVNPNRLAESPVVI